MSTAATGQQLQQIFGHASIQNCNKYSRYIFRQLHHCHTAAMGMHYYKCDDASCNHIHTQYHSCGNRHCPNCGGLKKEQWIENLTAQLFPTSYYHVVFTLPHEFNALILGNRKEMFNLLFESASATLLRFAADPQYLGAVCSITAVLHTWGQDLSFHPHLHCIVSGGGVKDNKWVAAKRTNDKFLFPVAALKKVYKGIFIKKLRLLLSKGLLQTEGPDAGMLIKKAGYKSWKVYAKSPFGSVASVVEYLGRYTHKIAITKHRVISITEYSVTFKYKDYADGNKQKTMTLGIAEFLRRFELHFLPWRYVKIRHYGFLQNHGKTTRLNAVRKEMNLQPLQPPIHIPVQQRMLEQYGEDISLCPQCKKGKLILIAIVYPKLFAARLTRAIAIDQPPALHNKASP
jgi:Putative transposase/Transposase zinc-binding domain